MQTQKRSWIYGGLAHPAGLVLAAPTVVSRRLGPGARLLLCGDEHAWGMSPFLGHLCRDGEVEFRCRAHRSTIEDWADTAGLRQAVDDFEPTVVAVSLGPTALPDLVSAATVRSIAQAARSRRSALVWVRPPDRSAVSRPFMLQLNECKVPSFHSEALNLPRGPDAAKPTARGYAGWAGALWRWIG